METICLAGEHFAYAKKNVININSSLSYRSLSPISPLGEHFLFLYLHKRFISFLQKKTSLDGMTQIW